MVRGTPGERFEERSDVLFSVHVWITADNSQTIVAFAKSGTQFHAFQNSLKLYVVVCWDCFCMDIHTHLMLFGIFPDGEKNWI